LLPITREFGYFMDLSVTADRTAGAVKKFTRVSGVWTSSGSGLEAQITVPVSPAGAALPTPDNGGGLTYTAFTTNGVAAVYYLARGASSPVQVVDVTPAPFAGRFHDVSPDGRAIVYSEADPPNGLFKVRNDGSERVRLVESDTRELRLTPDGQTALFTRSTPGLYSVATAGGTIRRLTDRFIPTAASSAGRRGVFSVSPDGKRVLFTTDKPGVVALCDLPGCTNLQDLRLPSADWAPDGNGVAYVKDATTIMEQPLDGSTPRVLVRFEGNEPIINFRWSPDGSRLAASRGRYPNDMVMIKGLR
jgi:Tol biopolymer transport system component